MTTIVLVMMCVAVGALELYAGRQGRDRERAYVRRIDALQDQVTRQNDALATVGEQLTAELARVQRDVLPGMETRVNDTAGRVAELADLVRQAEAYVRAQAGRMHDLEQQRVTLAALRRKLGEVEGAVRALDRAGTGVVEGKVDTALDRLADLARGGGEILDLQRTLTRTLEEVEDVVAELLRLTEGELDDAVAGAVTGRTPAAAPVRATGRLWTRDDQVRDILAEVYERAVRASGLEVRFRADAAERRRYFFGGRRVEDLGGTFTALLISTGADLRSGGRPTGPAPEDEAALKALLRTVFECTGAVAQIGPLLAVRTRDELLCAVLTPDQGLELENDELYFDPAAAAQRLRLLPPHQVWDLTAWGARA
ncbi:hypothetical protein [Actinomadura rayongensis]|uniref:Uncharacterized protein n=1 Tax=Actinomadura rayongensis TaxID=1429076 RepID=A0A6I4W236_9ACTN|nr:hypothetical protein [Actinomadura rayongensis]MXQ63543.1 hypothetical protein [Actinomadura rayongensis]